MTGSLKKVSHEATFISLATGSDGANAVGKGVFEDISQKS
jgi:hypothetical protein